MTEPIKPDRMRRQVHIWEDAKTWGAWVNIRFTPVHTALCCLQNTKCGGFPWFHPVALCNKLFSSGFSVPVLCCCVLCSGWPACTPLTTGGKCRLERNTQGFQSIFPFSRVLVSHMCIKLNTTSLNVCHWNMDSRSWTDGSVKSTCFSSSRLELDSQYLLGWLRATWNSSFRVFYTLFWPLRVPAHT